MAEKYLAERLQADFIVTTAALAEGAEAPFTEGMIQGLAGLIGQAQRQLTALQEGMPVGNVVQLP